MASIYRAVPGDYTRGMAITEMLHHGVIVDTLLIDTGGGGEAGNFEIPVDKRDNAGIQTKIFHDVILPSRTVNGSGRLQWTASGVTLTE